MLMPFRFPANVSPYLEQMKNPSMPFLGYYCRPLSVLWEEKDNRSAAYLLGTGC